MRESLQELTQGSRFLVTGAAGFIGFHLCLTLLKSDFAVIGIDNMNNYYDPALKEERLGILQKYDLFSFHRQDIANMDSLSSIFGREHPDIVVNLAAQAGVRYSIENPEAYVHSNLVGYLNVLECCRHFRIDHLVYASSSSVYGGNEKVPFSEKDRVDEPVSLYAATKKSNELMAHAYSKLYDVPATGLRFFTVYGPYGRPDMAYFKFAEKIRKGEPIEIYNNGNLERDFTYVDDVILGMLPILANPPMPNSNGVAHKIYNIGNSAPVKLEGFIETLEASLGMQATKEYLPMQQGDVLRTYADTSALEEDFGFRPSTPLPEGLRRFVTWYRAYRGVGTSLNA